VLHHSREKGKSIGETAMLIPVLVRCVLYQGCEPDGFVGNRVGTGLISAEANKVSQLGMHGEDGPGPAYQ